MSEYGTPCPGCRRILHVTIDLEPEPERAPEPEQLKRPATTKGAILGGIVSLESIIEHLDEPRESTPIDTRWIENRVQDGIDALVRVRDDASSTADCGCTIRKGPPWKLEPCAVHRAVPGLSSAETYRAAALIARSRVLAIDCPNADAASGATAAREVIGTYLDSRADQAAAGTTSGARSDLMSAIRNACNELIDMGNDAGHQLREASEPYRADA